MPYNEKLAERLRVVYENVTEVEEKKMFGGIAFMVKGHMSSGVVKDTLMVRVGPDNYEKALKRAHTREMDFTGKPLTGFIYVDPQGFRTKKQLLSWVEVSLNFVNQLPPKKKKK